MSRLSTILAGFGIYTRSHVTQLEQRQRDEATNVQQRHREEIQNTYHRAQAATVKTMIARGYDAGSMDRLSADWNPQDATADQHWLQSFPRLRSRARDLVMNDGYAERFLKSSRLNIPGPGGFKFQCDVREDDGRSDEVANVIIERAFNDWCKRDHCTVTGRTSFRKVQQIMTEALKRDGEAIAIGVYNASKYSFQLQVIEPDLIDERLNKKLDNGNVICLGIELDRFRKPVAYWIRPAEAMREILAVGWITGQSERIPAQNVFHVFDTRRAFQTRGVTHMSSSMRRLRTLHGAEEAYSEKVRNTASITGVWEQIDVTAPDPHIADGKTEREEPVQTIEPGIATVAPWGHKFSPYDPDFPTEAWAPFVKSSLRGISSGWGVSYNMMGNDLEGVNYSSIRAGVLDEHEYWKDDQELIKEEFLEPVSSAWLKVQLTTQVIPLPLAKFEKFNKLRFTGRRWAWVDPLKDIEAAIMEIQMGGSTLTRYLAEKGEDIGEILRERAEEQKLAAKYGILLTIDEKATTQDPSSARIVDEWKELISRFKDGSSTEDDDDQAMRILKRLLKKRTNGHEQGQPA